MNDDWAIALQTRLIREAWVLRPSAPGRCDFRRLQPRYGARIVTASTDKTTRIWDVHFATMSAKDLVAEVCTRRLRGLTKLTWEEMRLAGYPDSEAEIDVCAGVE